MKNKILISLFLAGIPMLASDLDFVTQAEQGCSKTFDSQEIPQKTKASSTTSKINYSTSQPPKFKPLRLPTTASDLPFQKRKKKVCLIEKNEPITLRKVVKEVAIGLGIFVGFFISLPLFVYLTGV